MTEKSVYERIKTVLSKYKWWILGIIFLYPFYCLLIGEILWNSGKELYTFGLPLRDFMTVWIALGGIIGVVFNIKLMQRRTTVQEKQQEEQQKRWEKQDRQQEKLRLEQQKQFEAQIEKQNAQIRIQQKQLRDTRFSSGVELLGNINESARIGGAYNLYFLANEHPDEYLDAVCEILCAHIRTITSNKDYQEKYIKQPSNEIDTILNLLFHKNEDEELIFDKCWKNLERTFLCGANICDTLSYVHFDRAILNGTSFSIAKLYNVFFQHIISLNDIEFFSAKLNEVYFSGSELNNVKFNNSKLNDISFLDAELNYVDFSNAELIDICFTDAKLKNEINFTGTVLEHYKYEEIVNGERALELTKVKKSKRGKNASA